MGSGGGGGDNGMMMMMMMLQMEQQKKQMEEQQRQQMFESASRAEGEGYKRYSDLVTAQNKKVGDIWGNYNANVDKIRKLNPQSQYQNYTWNPYAIDTGYKKGTDYNSANANIDLLNQYYGDLDKKSLDDYNYAKKQFDQSQIWLNEAKAQHDAGNRVVPGQAPGTWGAGGGQVSGEAGADSQKKPGGTEVGAAPGGLGDVFSGLAGGPSGTAPAASAGLGGGFLGGNDNAGGSELGSLFGKAIGGGSRAPKQAGVSIF